MPKISIIVPIYNSASFLENCVISILNQTFSDIEILLINDGSTDNSGELCEKLAVKDNRIKVVHQSNKGVSAARNNGISIAQGEYIGFVDSDDTVTSDMFELLYGNSIEFAAQISICAINRGETHVFSSKNSLPETFERSEAIKRLLNGNLDFGVYNKIYESSIAKSCTFEGAIFEDLNYCFNTFISANSFVFCDIPKYNYIKRGDSVSASKFDERYLEMTKVTGNILSIVEQNVPSSLEDAKLQFVISNISVINLILLSEPSKYSEQLKKSKQNLRGNHQFIIKNPKVAFKYKIAYQLISINENIYKFVMHLYCKLTNSDVIRRI